MHFVFPPGIQNGIASGAYEVVKNSAGVALGIARDKATGHFVGHAIQAVVSPFLGLPQIILGGANLLGEAALGVQIDKGFQKTYRDMADGFGQTQGMIADGFEQTQGMIADGFGQTHQILDSIQNSLVALQTTTSLIGVASVAGVALSGANLYQTLKLKKEIQELKYEVKDGFIQVLEEVRGIADEVELRNHRTILVMAYGEFLQATKLMKLALSTENKQTRHSTLSNAQLHLSNAYNAYSKPELFQNTTAAAQLRCLECAWMIEQTQAVNFQLMDSPDSASYCLSELQTQMQSKSLQVIDACSNEEELAFIYPEITRIHRQDLPILNTWESQINWMRQLTPSELKEITYLTNKTELEEKLPINIVDLPEQEPEEFKEYQELESQSHYESLRDQLRYTVQSELRQQDLNYIKQKAVSANLKGILCVNLEQASDLAIANLYNYVKATN